tara:strand:+ start:715 stop:1644 length:930 start_codon:yes stop_codon:yes gene_type:complete
MILTPSNQTSLFGHGEIFNELYNLNENNTLPNKILLSGEKGIGKSTLAYHLVNSVLSQDEKYSYDFDNFKINSENKSYKLIQNKSNPNFHLLDIEKEKKNINIDQVRQLILDLNKSSFNDKNRFVLIDNIELLNLNSINALLKVLEEPNDNINFILINNNKKIHATLKSRCLNFKVFLSFKKTINIANKILHNPICDLINYDLIYHYITPGKLIEMIETSKNLNIDIKNINLKDYLLLLINEKFYKKEKFIREIIYTSIELYFRNNISKENIDSMNFYHYFLKKARQTKIYNLDEEILFMEFKDKMLDE